MQLGTKSRLPGPIQLAAAEIAVIVLSGAITTAKFKTNKGQRSMLFSAAKLFNTYMALEAWIFGVGS